MPEVFSNQDASEHHLFRNAMIIAGAAGVGYGGYRGFKFIKGKFGKEVVEDTAETIAKKKAAEVAARKEAEKKTFKSGGFTYKGEDPGPKLHGDINEYLRKRGYTNPTIERQKAVEAVNIKDSEEFLNPHSEAWLL